MKKKRPLNTTGAVGGYLRVSDVKAKFPDTCTSLPDREAFVESLRRLRMSELIADAEAQGETITAWYDDMGISGTGEYLALRTDFDRARLDAKSGTLRKLYARDLSRLFRDLVQQELWFADMEKWGCDVAIKDLPFIADAATRILLRQNLGSLNQYMATKTGELLRLTHGQRVKAGLWVGRGTSMWGLKYNKETHQYDFDPLTADPIRFVLETLAESKGVAGQAARRLNEAWQAGHPRATLTPSGKLWTAQFVLRYARNRLYAREVHYFKGAPDEFIQYRPDLIPEVVDPALVAEVRRLLEMRAPGNLENAEKARAARLDYTYSQILACGTCGGRLMTRRPTDSVTGRTQTPPGEVPRWISWACKSATCVSVPVADRCDGFGHVQQRRIDALMGEGLAYALKVYGEQNFGALSRTGRQRVEKRPKKREGYSGKAGFLSAEGDKASLEGALIALETRRKRFHQMYAGEIIQDMAELQGYLAEIDQEKARILERLAATDGADGGRPLAAPAPRPALSEAQWERFGERVAALWKEPEMQPLNLTKYDLLKSLDVRAAVRTLPRRTKTLKNKPRIGPITQKEKAGKNLRGKVVIEMEVGALGLTGEHKLILTESDEAYQVYWHWMYWQNRGMDPPPKS